MTNNVISTGCGGGGGGGLRIAALAEAATPLPFASVSAVAEPETYAMVLSGLGLVLLAAAKIESRLIPKALPQRRKVAENNAKTVAYIVFQRTQKVG